MQEHTRTDALIDKRNKIDSAVPQHCAEIDGETGVFQRDWFHAKVSIIGIVSDVRLEGDVS